MAGLRFGRLITAMVTPFTADLDLDLPRAQELALRLLDNGSEALVVCGTTGESPTVFYDQKLERRFDRTAGPREASVAEPSGESVE